MKPNLASIHNIRDVAKQVYPTSPKSISLRDLFRRHDFRPADPRSLKALLGRWNPADGAVVFRVLWQNTFLMRIIGHVVVQMPVGFITVDKTIVEKPDTLIRAFEFGVVLSQSDFDAACLCEVWTDEVSQPILDSLEAAGKLQGIAEGPPGGTSTLVVAIGAIAPNVARIGSGLFVLGMTRGILESTYQTFSQQGSLPRDADALSQKSIMLSRIDVGSGVLDVYTTHLFNGGGLAGSGPSTVDRMAIQLTQLDEIVEFIKMTHRKENFAVLVGDFNINARDSSAPENGITSYQMLTSRLQTVELFDAWPFQFSQDVMATQGTTDIGMDQDGPPPPLLGGATFVCSPLGPDTSDLTPCSNPLGCFCSEDEGRFPPRAGNSQQGCGRIDYLFFERAQLSHKLNVVLSAVQREVFQTKEGSYPFLSDHLALTFNLICSMR